MLPPKVAELVRRYTDNRADYRAPEYKEFRLRKEFVDVLFESLGWDVSNSGGYSEAYKDVVHEDSIKVAEATKAPDYAFRIGGVRKFFVETKVPSLDIYSDPTAAYQLRRYGWSAKLPLSILTNFEQLTVYDCRIRPNQTDKASAARILTIKYDELENRWSELVEIFSREAILKGAFDRFAADSSKKRGTAQVDDAFLSEIEEWRETLARNFALRNGGITARELNDAVQRTIDRVIFLRFAEGRGFQPYGTLQALSTGRDVYRKLCDAFRKADDRYNSGLFHFRKGDGSLETLDTFTLSLALDDKVIRPILAGLYYPESPYEFSVLPADILGQVYEQFLGKVIRLSGRGAVIDDKPEVKKAGGVYYTPTHTVRYIVENTLRPALANKTPTQVSGANKRIKNASPLRILDPACGSGSFLLEAYQHLLDWHRDQYIQNGPDKYARGRDARLYQPGGGSWRLTINERIFPDSRVPYH